MNVTTPISANPATSAPDFLTGGGELGALMRAHDWSACPLGSPETWPQSLRTTVGFMLNSGHPMCLAWGSGPSSGLAFLYNDAYAPFLGVRHPAALGRPFAEVWSDVWSSIEPMVDRAMSGASTWAEDLPLVMERNGTPEETWWTFSYSPVRDESGGVGGMLNVCNETTARVRAERLAVAERERLTRMFEQAPGFMAMLRGPEHVFDLVNQAYMQLVGHRKSVGKPVREALPELEDQGFFELLDRVYATGEPFVGRALPVRLQREPGGPVEERFVDQVYQPVLDGDGRVTGIFVEGSDVTERVQAEAALRESAAFTQRILESSGDCIKVLSLDARLEFMSSGGMCVMEIDDFSAFKGACWPDFWRGEENTKARDAVAEARAGGTGRFQGFTATAKGSMRYWDVIVTPILGVDGQPEKLLSISRDISEQRRAEDALRELNETLEQRVAAALAERAKVEEQLRQAQKMEAVGQLTGGIAHDFNNLLTGIIGSLELLQRRVAEGRFDQLSRYTSVAVTSAQRAAALTQRLLAFSRRQPLDPRPVGVNGLVAGMEDLLRRTLGPHIDLEMVLAGGLWPTLCDPNQLESAILNLAINARDVMGDGGRLTIETANAHLDDAYVRAHGGDVRPGQYVAVCVTDTGSGMTPDVIARAFEPFFTTKPLGQGTGLGLSMLYGFVKQSDGHVKIYSEAGRGTTFKLYLPRHRGPLEQEVDVAGTASAPRAEQGETVLVVEDEAAVRMLITETLDELGYAAVEAADGPSGLRILQSGQRVDLLVTDVGLPGLNGRQLADAARQMRPELKVLFITGFAGNAAVGNGVLEPGMEMLTKPFAMDQLAAKIRDMIATM